MSIYGPRLRLPRISLPELPNNLKGAGLKALFIVLIIILLIATIVFFTSNPINFSNHINVSWNNNPLKLTEQTENAELNLIITNNTETTKNIYLEVISESNEIIIFCPDNTFPNVAPNHKRETRCIIKRNPNEKIFAGTYEIEIKTNLGEANTTLEIRK